jgi:hypothetical protein
MADRIFYPVHQVGIKADGAATYTAVHGVQSVTSSTNYNLRQIFELGQLALYQHKEDIPDVEFTITKALDGNPLIYHLATVDALTPTLVARSAEKCLIALAIFDDTATSAAGTPRSQVECSGMFASSLSFNFPLDDKFTESVTFIGNNKLWANDSNRLSPLPWADGCGGTNFTGAFGSLDSPPGSGSVQYREHLIFDADSTLSTDANGMWADPDCTILPPDVFGISSSGTNNKTDGQNYDAHISNISVSVNLTRESKLELGRRGPYSRVVTFPVEVTTEIQVTSTSGDMASATEYGIRTTDSNQCAEGGNLQDRTIRIATCDGTRLYLGLKNKLSATNYSGGDAGGGDVTVSYTFSTFSELSTMHINDTNVNFAWGDRTTYLTGAI